MGKEPIFELKPVSKTINASIAEELKTQGNIATEEMVNKAKSDFDAENNKFNEHKFLVKVDLEAAEILLDFIKTKAKWKFRNSFGIVQCSDVVEKAIKTIIKTKGIYLSSLELQAVSFFVGQHEDIGYEYAVKFVKIVDPLFETMQEANKWRTKVELLRQKFVLYEDSYKQQIPIEDVNIKDMTEKENKLKQHEDGRNG